MGQNIIRKLRDAAQTLEDNTDGEGTVLLSREAGRIVEVLEEAITEIEDQAKTIDDFEETDIGDFKNSEILAQVETRFDVTFPEIKTLEDKWKFEHFCKVHSKYNYASLQRRLPE